MIVYFDTSAFIPLLIGEPGSVTCERLWADADAVVSTRLLYVETAAGLARAQRLRRITGQQRGAAVRRAGRLWAELQIVEVDEDVMVRAAELARGCALRGYDAVHCASAERLGDDDLVVASGDGALLDACRSLGMATADINHT